MGKIKRYFH